MSDLVRGYRVCYFNDAAHGGVHVHDALTGGNDWPVAIGSEAAAAQIMRGYAVQHDVFQKSRFESEVKRWKSK